MRRTRALLLAGSMLVVAGCGAGEAGTPASDEAIDVVAAFYPLQFLAERIGGEQVRAENLTPPGAEPHDLELSARQTARMNDADLALVIGGFQPAVDEVAETLGDRSLDLSEVEPLTTGYQELNDEGAGHGGDEAGTDPHIWLDPVRMQRLASAVADRLAAIDPGSAQVYRDRAAQLTSELSALDAEFKGALASCARKELVTSHNAFGYLTKRYQLVQVGISGLSPDEEPSPRRIAEVASLAKARGVTTIFFEELVSPAIAKTVAREVGAQTAVLSTLEGAPESGDYFSAMRANLATMTNALGCS